MGKFATGCYGLGSWVERSIQDTRVWLGYTYRCASIVVSQWLSEKRKLIRCLGKDTYEQCNGERQARIITHLPRSMARYIRYPLVRFHKMKYSIFLGAIPMLIAGLGSIACCEEVIPIKVRTETITRASGEPFIERWQPLADMPKRVRVIPIVVQTKGELVDEEAIESARQSVAQADRIPLPRNRPKTNVEDSPKETRSLRYTTNRRDVCARHNMRRVYYGRYRWRCR
jgi:hypothetical protein